MQKRRALVLALATSWLLAAPVAFGEEIRAVSEKLDEKVEGIEIQSGRAVLKLASRTIPLEQVKSIRFDERVVPDSAGAKVVLSNKDEVRGAIGASTDKGNGFQLRTSAIGNVDVSLDNAVAIFFDVPPETERKLSTKLLGWVSQPDFQGRPEKDAIYIRAGGKVEGLVNAVSSQGIEVDAGQQLGTLKFALKEVELVVFGNTGNKPPALPAGTAVRIRCADGSLVSGTIQRLADGKIELQGNPLVPSGTLTVQLKDAVELLVLNGAFVYLSDMNPTKVDEKFPEGYDWSSAMWGWKRDRVVLTGARLHLGGRAYDKGLGVHTYSSLTFPLNGAYKKFRAVIGLDDSVKYYGTPGMGGGVIFRVLVDGKPAKELPEGVKKKKGEAPQELEVDVQGAKELTLVADYGGFMQVLGRADWADAHLVK